MESDSHKKRLLDPYRIDAEAIEAAVDVLRNGGLIILPTETVYGLAGDLQKPGVLKKIYRAKGRPESKPIPLFARHVDQIQRMGAELGPAARRLATALWPGPLTLVIRTGKDFTGFRIPDYPPVLALLEAYGDMLGVTSANRSGESETVSASQAERALGSWVDLVLDAGRSPGGTPSTVVKAVGDSVDILREGAIPAERIRQIVSDIFDEQD